MLFGQGIFIRNITSQLWQGRKTHGLRSFVAKYSHAFVRPILERYVAKESLQ
ncbi:hypothetical protein P20480_0786 [Pseudoalteromonas sp. BSi20480]|nr:hypothetical protein P20480_0786 [Pseudoalteromonas sp. BSi20480]